MSDIKLPRMPNVQVPRIDADVSLIDIRVLAKWCQRVAADYARAAVEADRAGRAQQDAPTDAELEQSIYETAGVFVKQPGEPAEFHCRRDDLPKIARAVLARYAPAQDAERERDGQIPAGWVFSSADFSIQAADPTQPGRVMLVRDMPGRKWWHSLPEEDLETVNLHVFGTGMTMQEATANAADAARAQRAAEGDE